MNRVLEGLDNQLIYRGVENCLNLTRKQINGSLEIKLEQQSSESVRAREQTLLFVLAKVDDAIACLLASIDAESILPMKRNG